MDTNQTPMQTTPNWRPVLDRSAAIATLIGIPFTILLMYCAWLPVLMGMYFFILGGMLVGSIWFRLASHVRPVPAAAVRLRLLTMLVLLTGLYLVSEYYVKVGHLTRDLTNLTLQYHPVATLTERQARDHEAAAHVQQTLRRYGPGPLGYLAWAVTDGQLPPMDKYTAKTITLPQRQAFYILRVVVSVTLLWYGLHLMSKDLTKRDDPAPTDAHDTSAPPI